MPWQKAKFKDQQVWAEVNEDGEPKVIKGRVPIRYQASASAKIYNAGRDRVEVVSGQERIELALDSQQDTSAKKVTKASGFGSAKNRTEAQKAMAKEAALNLISKLEAKSAVLCFTDGACRGNPGPAGSGVYIIHPDQTGVRISKNLGKATNNVAELTAIKIALEELLPEETRKQKNCPLHRLLLRQRRTHPGLEGKSQSSDHQGNQTTPHRI